MGSAWPNVLNLVDGLDLRLSEVEPFPDDYLLPRRRGLIRSVNAPVLFGPAVAPYNIFRFATYPAPLCICRFSAWKRPNPSYCWE